MVSRADDIHYFGHAGERPRRAVRYPDHDDRISLPSDTLPSDRSGSFSGALLASALIATSLIAGGVYALYSAGLPQLAQAEAAPLASRWQLDSEPVRAQNVALTVAPAPAAPSVATEPALEQTDTPAPRVATPDYAPMPSRPARPAPATPAPAPIEPEATRETVYPDPVTTPPDAIAPPDVGAEQATPLLEPENPYR